MDRCIERIRQSIDTLKECGNSIGIITMVSQKVDWHYEEPMDFEFKIELDKDGVKAPKEFFENLIKGEYKSEFDARVQNIINKRFGKVQQTEEQMKSLQPVLDMLSQKYGVDKGDFDSLSKAIQDDDAYYEDEALQKGLSVKQLKEMKKLERENENLRKAQEEAKAKVST
jgi:hypothetical protein